MIANSLPELLLAAAAEDPGRPFLRFGRRTFSRAEMAEALLRTAGWFQAGDRVALMLENRPEFLMAWLGAGLAGAVAIPLDPSLRGKQLAARFRETRPRFVVAEPFALPAILALRAPVPSPSRVIVVGEAPAGTIPWSELLGAPPANPASLDPDAAMQIVYTAGATGRARGVVWRHGGPAAAGAAMAQLLGLDEHDRFLIVLPLFAANAQLSVAIALGAGGSILLERDFSAPTFWTAARSGGATVASLSGALLSRLHARRPRDTDAHHTVEKVLGIGTPKELHEAFENRFGVSVIEAFGITEAGFVTVNPIERGRRKLGTIGLPVPWCEVAILDEKSRRLPPGAIGEICVRPRSRLLGYAHGDSLGAEGWVRSGDLGAVDEEEFFTLLGRREDLRAVDRVPKTPTGRIRKSELRGRPGIFDDVHRVCMAKAEDEP